MLQAQTNTEVYFRRNPLLPSKCRAIINMTLKQTANCGRSEIMTTEGVRVWLVPQKFWAATQNMQPEQADSLLQKVSEMAERKETDALRQFDFIIVGTPQKHMA